MFFSLRVLIHNQMLLAYFDENFRFIRWKVDVFIVFKYFFAFLSEDFSAKWKGKSFEIRKSFSFTSVSSSAYLWLWNLLIHLHNVSVSRLSAVLVYGWWFNGQKRRKTVESVQNFLLNIPSSVACHVSVSSNVFNGITSTLRNCLLILNQKNEERQELFILCILRWCVEERKTQNEEEKIDWKVFFRA